MTSSALDPTNGYYAGARKVLQSVGIDIDRLNTDAKHEVAWRNRPASK